eukprot:3684618-Rhodomonas_salina.1
MVAVTCVPLVPMAAGTGTTLLRNRTRYSEITRGNSTSWYRSTAKSMVYATRSAVLSYASGL